MKKIFLCVFFFLSACGARTPSVQPEALKAYATSAAQFWLAELYACAEEQSVIIRISAEDADIELRLGEPEDATSPMYQIGEEEIVIAANNASPLQTLSLLEAQELFALGDSSAQLWVFSSGEDTQSAFDRLVMKGRGVASSARLAASAQQMSIKLGTESNAVGILPARWINENTRVLFSAGVVPVLAVAKEKPSQAAASLIACLQKR